MINPFKRSASEPVIEVVNTVELKLPKNGLFRGAPNQSEASVKNELKHILLYYKQYRTIPNGVVKEIHRTTNATPFDSSGWSYDVETPYTLTVLRIQDRLKWILWESSIKYIDAVLKELKLTKDPIPENKGSARVIQNGKNQTCAIELPYATIHLYGDFEKEMRSAFIDCDFTPIFIQPDECEVGHVLITNIDPSKASDIISVIRNDTNSFYQSIFKDD